MLHTNENKRLETVDGWLWGVWGRTGSNYVFLSRKTLLISTNEITLEVFKLEVAYDPVFAVMFLIYEHKFERCTFRLKLFCNTSYLFLIFVIQLKSTF